MTRAERCPKEKEIISPFSRSPKKQPLLKTLPRRTRKPSHKDCVFAAYSSRERRTETDKDWERETRKTKSFPQLTNTTLISSFSSFTTNVAKRLDRTLLRRISKQRARARKTQPRFLCKSSHFSVGNRETEIQREKERRKRARKQVCEEIYAHYHLRFFSFSFVFPPRPKEEEEEIKRRTK